MNAIKRRFRKLRRKVRHHGLWRVMYVAVLTAVGHHRWLRVLRGHCVEEVNGHFLQAPSEYAGSFFAPRAIEEFARDPETELSGQFVQNALHKGDKCYGFTRDRALKAYGWYASNPTRISPELRLHFSRAYIYMYKGFTHEMHRGKRLYPAGMSRALRHYRAAGYKGMLLYVDANNLDSLRSCARMGFRIFGSIYVAKLFGRYFIFESPGCAPFGFRLEVTLDTQDGGRAGKRVPA